jgi:hypothetical protein
MRNTLREEQVSTKLSPEDKATVERAVDGCLK